jgi:hypothetical protein
MFDSYSLRARIAPASIAALPALVLVGGGLLSPVGSGRIVGTLTGAVLLVVSQLVRDAGRKLQPALWDSWGGSPTLTRLRWSGSQDATPVQRLHNRLTQFLPDPLPTAAEEEANPEDADRRYNEAIAVLRERTRDSKRFKLVFAENVNYGFRRNLLGLRRIGIIISILTFVCAVGLAVFTSSTEHLGTWGTVAAVALIALIFWWRVVTGEWVRRAAELYADRLIESADTLAQDAKQAKAEGT